MKTSPRNYAKTISIKLPLTERLKLEKAAAAKNMTVQELVYSILQVSTHLQNETVSR